MTIDETMPFLLLVSLEMKLNVDEKNGRMEFDSPICKENCGKLVCFIKVCKLGKEEIIPKFSFCFSCDELKIPSICEKVQLGVEESRVQWSKLDREFNHGDLTKVVMRLIYCLLSN